MNEKIPVIISGLPGKMATAFLEKSRTDPSIDILPFALTGPNAPLSGIIADTNFLFVTPDQRESALNQVHPQNLQLVIVDFSTPDAALENARLYCRLNIPFVMGTTMPEETRTEIERIVKRCRLYAVIAPNMSAPVVLIQSMLEWAAKEFPNALTGFDLSITESHQSGKKDTSGTARAMLAHFSAVLGHDLDEDLIRKIRDPETQQALGVPEQHLSGHGWHTYDLDSPATGVHLSLTHNVNGRATYAEGALRAVRFLAGKWRGKTGSDALFKLSDPGHVFSMIDVFRG